MIKRPDLARPLPKYCEGICLKTIKPGKEKTIGKMTVCSTCYHRISRVPILVRELAKI